MDTDSFIVHLKLEEFYEDLAGNAEKRIHTSNYEIKRPLPIGENKKVIKLMTNELGRKIMK